MSHKTLPNMVNVQDREAILDVPLLIRHRLDELGLEQKDLATAAQVTESYISQLLTRKKAPPAPGRTDIYDKLGEFLRLPSGELAKLAENQRQVEWKKKVAEPPRPLYQACRELVLRKCDPGRQTEIRRIFEQEPFGELERLITQKLLDVAQEAAREELRGEGRLHQMAAAGRRSYEQMRVAMLEFLDTDVFNVSLESCIACLEPMIESWDIDLRSFAIEIVLNERLALGGYKRFEFVERVTAPPLAVEPGLERFLKDPKLSGDVTEEEIEFLRGLSLRGRRPAPLYYYRELQNLRDPLHFPSA